MKRKFNYTNVMKFLTTGLLTFALAALIQAQQAPNPPAPPAPPAPAPPAPAASEPESDEAEDAPLAMDAVIPMADLQLVNMPIEQFLKIYADYVNRTILRQSALPNLNVTLEAQTPLTVEEAIQAMDSVLSLNGYTTIPVGEKFITFVPSANALQEGAAFTTVTAAEELPEANQFITHISQLKHILPSEAVPMLTPMAKNPAGIVALDVSKTLVLRDNSSNIKRMLELLQRIDIKPDEDFKLKVIPIRYGKVEEIYASMQELITGSGGGARPSSSSSRTSPTSRTSSSRTSSSRVSPQQNRTSTASNNSSSSSFRSRLQSIVNRASGGDIQILENARIVPDYRSNSLIIFANDRDMAKIDEIVAQVDSILAQVLIEAIIVNVTLSDGMDTGVNLLMNETKGSNPQFISGSMNGGPSTTINTPAPSVPNNPGQGGFAAEGGGNGGANTVAEAAGNAVGTFSSSMLSGGFSYLSRYDNGLDFAMSALAQNSSAKVMQTPRVQTSHAVPATFFNGEQVPYQGSSGYGGSYGGYGGSYGGYGGGYGGGYTQFLNVGITLDVTPYITPDDLVVMEIAQTISELEGFVDMGGGQVDGGGMKAPQTTEREASSTISVKDGDTILLGGFIRSAKTDTESGVPFLKDVPLLGNLFKNNSKTSKRSELLVLIRPTILDTPEEAALMSQKERMRLPGVREAEAEFTEDERKRMRRVEQKLGNGLEGQTKKPAAPPGRKPIVNPVF
jgi:general secretion pathway protein D